MVLLNEQVLMRALRDFNLPKIVTEDVPVFLGLVSDLFPGVEVQRRTDWDFEQLVRQSAMELKLQPEDPFILKVKLTNILQDFLQESSRKEVFNLIV